MAIKRGRLPMSTPGVLNMMFKKYNKIIFSGHVSNKNSQIDIN